MNAENKNALYLIFAVIVIVALGIFVLNLIDKQIDKNDSSKLSNITPTQNPSSATLNPTADPADPNIGEYNELVIEDTVVGTGIEATTGKSLNVIYTGKLPDGTVFDSNVGGSPFTFTLGAGQVISGWDQGLVGMKEGGKRTLKIPSSLGYGEFGSGGVIKPYYDLVFEVELISVD